MKVYTVIAKYMGYDEYPDKYLGTYDTLEHVIEELGIGVEYINKQWGSVEDYIRWFKNRSDCVLETDTGTCYVISGNLEWGYFLYIYETDLKIQTLKHSFV